MAKLELNAISASYTFAEPAQTIHQSLPGGLPRQRADMLDGMSRLVSITFVCDGAEYNYLVDFVRQNIADDCPLIQIDLIVTEGSNLEFDAFIVPDTFQLDAIEGYTFTCSLQVMTMPLADETVTWPIGWTADIFQLPPDKAGYTIKYGSESISIQYEGNIPKQRRSYFNASRIGSLRWNCTAADYSNFFEAYRYWVNQGGKPFYMDLFMDRSALTRHRCTFIPGSVRLSSHQGNLYIVEADLEIESDPWPKSFVPHLSTNTTAPIPTPWDPFTSTGGAAFEFTSGNFIVTSTDGSGGIVYNETPWLGGYRYAEFVVGISIPDSTGNRVGFASEGPGPNNLFTIQYNGEIYVDESTLLGSLTLADGDVVMIAINDIGWSFIGVNGTWFNDPVTETDPLVMDISGPLHLAYRVNSAEGVFSAETRTVEAQFTYPIPTGYAAWID